VIRRIRTRPSENTTPPGVAARLLAWLDPQGVPARLRRPLHTEELLRRVRRIEIASRKLSQSHRTGQYRAAFQGRGMEFAEVRDYRPGDDIRTIDWNVTARMGVPFVKVFREERDLTLLLIIDVSASQEFGAGYATKRELAAEATAALALSAAGNRDRVGAILVSDRIESLVPPRRGRAHALRLVRDALDFAPRGQGTDLTAGLLAGDRLLKSRAIVVVLSDFLATGYEHALTRLGRRHDVVALVTSDPAEQGLSGAGLIRMRDAETGRVRLVAAGAPSERRAWTAAHAAARERLRGALRSAGAEMLPLSTRVSPIASLERFFREREKRRTR
jgi:uncharacterized protein (DUF58 family)